MNKWMIFLIITFVLGIIVSNIMLLKHSAKMKVPASVLKKIAEKKKAEALKAKNKKPAND